MVEWQTRIILPLNGACEGRVVWATEQGETQSQKTLVQPTAQVQVSGRPAPRLAPPSPAAIRQEMNTSCSPPGRCGAAINLVNIPTDTKNCLSCWSNGRFITRGQTFPPPRKAKTVHKSCLAKKKSLVAQSVINTGKCSLTTLAGASTVLLCSSDSQGRTLTPGKVAHREGLLSRARASAAP